MKVNRLAIPTIVLSLAFAAFSGAISTAFAQGAAWDTPTGYGRAQQAIDPEPTLPDASAQLAFFVRHLVPDFLASRASGFTSWSLSYRASLPNASRAAGARGEHRPALGPVSRQRSVAGGR